MNPRRMLLGATLVLGGVAASADAALAQCGPAKAHEQGETKTITAQVVDMSCYLAQDLKGPDHKMCAEVCAKAGVPLVFLGQDGQLYLPVSSAMPSEGFNEQLVEHAEENVRVTGKVARKSGARSITVEKIEATG